MPPKRTETTRKLPTINPMFFAVALALIGWAGVVYLVNNVHPTLPMQAAFLALWGIALIGTVFPVLLALHRRFRGEPSPWMVWRQSTWIGILGSLAAWLQMNRVLNMATAAIVAGLFVVIEVILNMRARQESRND
jgi:drug/metabolite transporter (DMT)-like permease